LVVLAVIALSVLVLLMAGLAAIHTAMAPGG